MMLETCLCVEFSYLDMEIHTTEKMIHVNSENERRLQQTSILNVFCEP